MNDLDREITCPRCGGAGRRNWRPDSGICYRCRGTGVATINLASSLAALRHLRDEYRRLRAQVGTVADGEFLQDRLAHCVESGQALRADLLTAGCPEEYVVQGFWPRQAS